MSGTTKWDDAAVKDLTMAILMSANNGNVNISANWDKVADTMACWGYGFTKSAMSQHWSKKVVKQFKERHGNMKGSYNSDASPMTPKKAATPRKRTNPKTPGTGRGKKRAADDDDDDETSPETSYIVDPIAKQKTPRSATAKKVKYEEADDEDSEAKAEILVMSESLVEPQREKEAAAEKKALKDDADFYDF